MHANCESCDCEIEIGLDIDLCESCYAEKYCECGSSLGEDMGTGFCKVCS